VLASLGLRGHKAVFNAEYNLSTANFCPADNAAGFNGALFRSTSPGAEPLSLIRVIARSTARSADEVAECARRAVRHA